MHAELDIALLQRELAARNLQALTLQSAITQGRREYLRRPDLGRKLSAASRAALSPSAPDVIFILADGLSSLAVERHAIPLLDALLPQIATQAIAPICIVTQARVAIADEIGEALAASLTVLLIGERPGLSAADSLGAYITWKPRAGRTDAERNCVSNIRAEGLSYAEAAQRILSLIAGAKALGATGIALKDPTTTPGLP